MFEMEEVNFGPTGITWKGRSLSGLTEMAWNEGSLF
jgi:hypothetical protein